MAIRAETRAELLNIRCYIEGVQVPVISATVTQAVQSPASSYIQIIGTEEALQIRPRSIIEVYYRQNGPRRKLSDVARIPYYSYTGNVNISREMRNISSQKQFLEILADNELTLEELEEELQYDQLFVGEIIGYTFFEDAQSRVINILGMDFSNHLDTINQFVFDANAAQQMGGLSRYKLLAGNSEAAGAIGSESNVTGFVEKNLEFDGAGGNADDIEDFDLSSVAGGVLGLDQKIARILEAYGLQNGIRFIFDDVKEGYIYYRDVDEEINIRDSIFVANDPAARKLFSKPQLIEYIFGFLNRYGSLNSVKNLIKIVFKLTHFEFVPLTVGPFYLIPEFNEDATIEANLQSPSVEDDPTAIPALRQTLIRPEMYFSEPPACNVIFPDEMYSLNVSRQFLSEPTRGIDSTDHVLASEELGTSGLGPITNRFTISPSVLVKDGKVISYAPPDMVSLINKLNKDIMAFAQQLLPEEVFKGIIPSTSYTNHRLRTAFLSNLSEGETAFTIPELGDNLNFENIGDIFEFDQEDRLFFVRESTYRFLSTRFQPRTAAVSTKFLPRLVPGYTALVTEKSPRKSLDTDKPFYGFIGHVLQVTHFVSQAGGVTSLNMSHVRPTNEYLDFFTTEDELQGPTQDGGDLSGGGVRGVTSLVPDYREFTLPWSIDPATGENQYGPDNIREKYGEWFGGLDWRGGLVGTDLITGAGSTQANTEYLGILPFTEAAIKKPGVLPVDNSDLSDDGSGNFLKLTRALIADYQANVADPDNEGKESVEEWGREFSGRPVANRLQVRGWLNAYYANQKEATVSSPILQWRARQRALKQLGFYDGDIDGLFDAATSEAVRAFQAYAVANGFGDVPLDVGPPDPRGSNPVRATGNWDEATSIAVQQVLKTDNPLSRGLSTEQRVKTQRQVQAKDEDDKTILTNRIKRRALRLQAVLRYLESLESRGGGLVG